MRVSHAGKSQYLPPMRLVLSLFLLFLPAPLWADCVVMLHGLARTEASFTLMDEVFEARGLRVVRPGYPSTDLPIPELAQDTLPAAEWKRYLQKIIG